MEKSETQSDGSFVGVGEGGRRRSNLYLDGYGAVLYPERPHAVDRVSFQNKSRRKKGASDSDLGSSTQEIYGRERDRGL